MLLDSSNYNIIGVLVDNEIIKVEVKCLVSNIFASFSKFLDNISILRLMLIQCECLLKLIPSSIRIKNIATNGVLFRFSKMRYMNILFSQDDSDLLVKKLNTLDKSLNRRRHY